MSLPLLLHQRPACLARLIWMAFKMSGRRPYSCYFVECCLPDSFNTTSNILVQLPSSFLFIHLVSVHIVNPYSSIDTTTAWKKMHFILSDRAVFHMTDSLSMAIHGFVSRVLISFSEDGTLLQPTQNSQVYSLLSFHCSFLRGLSRIISKGGAVKKSTWQNVIVVHG